MSFNISGNDTDGNGLSLADGIDLFVNDNATSTINIIDNSFVDLGTVQATKPSRSLSEILL
ncbi:hypothetical protein [Candidatus Reidiella endopervernicosa]|uniref:Uncharacterized protein n=1 Tax=Candidatus Reidiella endopervernicosa TaxID=2738883 RepID=A0A6N0HWN4_9GAMM|nr:hypothetical protein [Candidatus Reidiella endopervernicosa]QKQ26815.1 hypothetical protein HUE57_11365 [Candidatus Reidiella endopervernicosa]